MLVIGTSSDKVIFDQLNHFNIIYQLDNHLAWQEIEKVSQKSLMAVAVANRYFMAIIKNTPQLLYYDDQSDELIKIAPNWQSLTKRIVSAGRKKELLLQACKLTPAHRVIDATAGFGHDGLLLASTGAKVVFIEQNPIMALLLLFEYWHMSQHQNWQKLLGRISIYFGSAIHVLPNLEKADLIYLDPMFPAESYQAKVGKHMQLLHILAKPPSFTQEVALLDRVKTSIGAQGKVVVKRPVGAPYLAECLPTQSYANDAIRFDVYQSHNHE